MAEERRSDIRTAPGSRAWTGFTGNTLWDWLLPGNTLWDWMHLLLLPLLLPTLVVPALLPLATSGIEGRGGRARVAPSGHGTAGCQRPFASRRAADT